MRLDAATVLLQWAIGGMFFCWITTRQREVGLGYGWLLRGIYSVIALGAVAAEVFLDAMPIPAVSSVGVVLSCVVALGSSVHRRQAGVEGQSADQDRRTERIAAMTGAERTVTPSLAQPEFDPRLDLVPVGIGLVGLVASGASAGGPVWLGVSRTVVGAAFLGAITDAMLLGHWYLVQPGLARRLLVQMVRCVGWVWPAEIMVMILPTGMLSGLSGSIDDGWGGILSWTWAGCAVTTIVLIGVTRAALKERQYSAIMAATGLLYLAILTSFGTDLVARAVLAT